MESMGQNSFAPQRTLESRVPAALGRQIDRGRDRVVADVFHALVGERDRLIRDDMGHAQVEQRVLETHDAQAHRAVTQIGVARLGIGVEVDVHHVVEHPHGGGDGLAPASRGRCPLLGDVLGQVDRAEVANRDLVTLVFSVISVQRFEVVHDADVLLRRADVARVLEGDPRVPGLEQHREHLAPQLDGTHLAEDLDLAPLRRCSY